MLREWQAACLDKALQKYKSKSHHFFCQATPGAGKTKLAAEIARKLLEDDLVELIVCFSPSLTVADGIKFTFSRIVGCTFNGGLGSIGQSLTYQSMQYLNDEFWQTLKNRRVFVVFDEIHHCSGTELENANVWGQQILTKIQGLATYTLALSGTPWRSDSLPITMGEYTTSTGQLKVDFQYTLKQAINDRVCRIPKIVLVDNEHLTLTNDDKVESFSSILEMLKETNISYQSVIHNPDAMDYLIGLGCQKLAELRCHTPNAGGLIVASSVKHAQTIEQILAKKYAQTVSIVTYRHDEPIAEIERFRQSTTQWIVSVGMISEGTDIPRLQVCCHMSSVKTELYFRQVLGRILRINGDLNHPAWLFTFAEKNLVEFAERIEQDIPETCMFAKIEDSISLEFYEDKIHSLDDSPTSDGPNGLKAKLKWHQAESQEFNQQSYIDDFDELKLGAFKQRVIDAFLETA